ncbi:MAG: hypothetical protein JXR41_10825, partial [Bacteroidales bacterium]|nr:hypothetical protein [Bacteroidales bacterium]
NDEIMSNIPFDTKLMSDFPPYYFYRPVISIKYQYFSLGVLYTFCSTGSRISARDYSGEYLFDMKINANSPGVCLDVEVLSKRNFHFALGMIFGSLSTDLRTHEFFSLLDSVYYDDSFLYESLNYLFEPGLKISYHINRLEIGMHIDYLLQIGEQAFYFGNNMKNMIYNSITRQPVKPDWTGLRIGFSLYCTFP